jgi:hypothetical protein
LNRCNSHDRKNVLQNESSFKRTIPIDAEYRKIPLLFLQAAFEAGRSKN